MNEHHCHEYGCACGHEHHEEKVSRTDWIRFIGTLVTGIAAVLLPHPTYSVVLWGVSYLFVGSHIIVSAVYDLLRKRPFTENLLMAIASLAAFGIGEHLEAITVLLFYQIGEILQRLAVGRSRASVKALLDIRPDQVYIDGCGYVAQDEVKAGDIAIVKPGERIPIDGTVISGETTVDTSALTGESLPRSVSVGDEVIGGFINLTGMIYVRSSGTAAESTLSRILHIVEESEKRKAKAQNFISRFASWYTPTVMVVALLTAIIPILFFGYHVDHIYRAAVLLTISCPCALVISIPIGYFGGIGGASRQGILFKGANYLEQMGRVSTVIMDKTGTLTSGSFSIREVRPTDNADRQEIMAVCLALEQNSNHPLAQAIRHENYTYNYTVQQVTEIAGYGVMALLDGKPALAGSADFLMQNGIQVPDIDTPHTVIHVARDGQYLGMILVGDTIKETSRSAIAQLRKLGVKQVIMLTGDRQSAAGSVARELGLNAFRAQLLPDEKVRAFEELAQGVTAFVGDGVNDAPVLARADIGVAMGGLGSDAAIETADMVIMDDNLEKLALAIRISRRTRRLVIENIVFALSVKLAVVILGLFGYMWLWLAILADTGVALIAVLNSLRALRVK